MGKFQPELGLRVSTRTYGDVPAVLDHQKIVGFSQNIGARVSKAPAESVSLQMFKNAKYRSLLIQTEFLGSGLGEKFAVSSSAPKMLHCGLTWSWVIVVCSNVRIYKSTLANGSNISEAKESEKIPPDSTPTQTILFPISFSCTNPKKAIHWWRGLVSFKVFQRGSICTPESVVSKIIPPKILCLKC